MQIYKRIALLGAIANPNIGDEAILFSNLQNIKKMYGANCKVFIFTKDASYTAIYSSENMHIIPVDYLHKITVESNYDILKIKKKHEMLLNYNAVKSVKEFDVSFEAIHSIFKEIDILHIIGGGYLNSLWPDMLYEVLTAVRLAKLYNKGYIMTGISCFPIKKEDREIVSEIYKDAIFIDCRDNTLELLQLSDHTNYQISVDDAIYLETPFSNNSHSNYANIVLHDWHHYTDTILNKIQSELIKFIQQCIESKIVDSINILGFSEGDLNLWKEFDLPKDISKNIYFQNCINENCMKAKHIIQNARFNVSSRYHAAVFSLSSNTPIFSIYYDEYYKNKIESLHKLYHSEEVCFIEDITADILMLFVESSHVIKNKLEKSQKEIYQLYLEKCRSISDAYALNVHDAEHLYRKLLNKSMPKISIIIPIFNMDSYLRECLDSVLCQTLKEIEIICINDGSTDYSQMILNEYSWKDPRIKVISHSNQGVAYSRNVGMEIASGEFLYFLDPDDWLPDKKVLYDLYEAAKANHVLICGGTFTEYSANGIINDWTGNLSKYNFANEGIINYREYQFDYGWVRFIYNREFIIYNDLKIPSLKFFEDPVFFVKAMHKAKQFYALKRCTYCYRTGYKSVELSYEKVVDLVKGLSENIRFAIEQNYNDLLSLEIARIEEDYAEQIVKHLIKSNAYELRSLLNQLNETINNGNNKIEYRMYNKIINNKDYSIWKLTNECDELKNNINSLNNEIILEKSNFYSSTTWKIGNFILYIPKKIKEKFLRRKI